MEIPKYDELFNPLLEALHNLDGSSKIKKIEKEVARILNLSEGDTSRTRKLFKLHLII